VIHEETYRCIVLWKDDENILNVRPIDEMEKILFDIVSLVF
jgi:hypothetical protein